MDAWCRQDSDFVFTGLISGTLPVVLMAAIHSDLVKTWWTRNLLPQSLWRLQLFTPNDFAKVVKTRRFFNYLTSGLDRSTAQKETQYRLSWVNLLRSVFKLCSELGQTDVIPPNDNLRLEKNARDFILDLLFAQLGPARKEKFVLGTKPRMNWAFVTDRECASRLFAYDDFTAELMEAA